MRPRVRASNRNFSGQPFVGLARSWPGWRSSIFVIAPALGQVYSSATESLAYQSARLLKQSRNDYTTLNVSRHPVELRHIRLHVANCDSPSISE